jgi:predicted dehydrogenase
MLMMISKCQRPFHYIKPFFFLLIPMLMTACDTTPDADDETFTGEQGEVRIMTLNPGHFHAALVQKDMIHQVDPTVYIFAPQGPDLDLHMERIMGFNNREENPTNWQTEIYTGPDYLERMLNDRPGNVMVTAGNNRQKTEYIKQAVDNGIYVLSDKPMAIDQEGWQLLVDAFESAEENEVLLYDIMTERYEVTSAIQRRLAQNSDLFGELIEGSSDQPAIEKESVHYLFKTVAGSTLRRPPWYFDVEQQGEGIVDVTTHLVDLSMWGSFPDQAIDYRTDIEMLGAERWPTQVTREQFENITGEPDFPDYLQNQLIDGVLPLYCNGRMEYLLHGHHTSIAVEWGYQAPPGGDDTHFSVFRGTNSNLVIRQGEEQNFQSILYIEPSGSSKDALTPAFEEAVVDLEQDYPGITYHETDTGWQLDIPDEFYLGHEAHFGKVAEAYFGYLVDGELPHWEVPNMITKYYITTQARELALD